MKFDVDFPSSNSSTSTSTATSPPFDTTTMATSATISVQTFTVFNGGDADKPPATWERWFTPLTPASVPLQNDLIPNGLFI